MAEQFAFFYNSDIDQNGEEDRVYDADSMSEWLKKFFTTGVFVGDLQVTSNNNMTVNTAPGHCYIDGKLKPFKEKTLTLDTADASLDRIDLIVAERNDTERDFFIKVVNGGYSSQPVAPELVRNGVIYQLCLAQVYVAAGAVRITQAEITDTRAISALCGYVAATVKQIDFTQMQAQFDSYFGQYKNQIEADYAAYEEIIRQLEEQGALDLTTALATFQEQFTTWFEDIKGQLDGDIAGHLQNEITEHEDRLALLEYMLIQDDITAPINLAETGDPVVLVDESGSAILADWEYAHK